MSKGSDSQAAESSHLEHKLPPGSTLPGPGEILCCRKYGDYLYAGMVNGDVYVSPDDGETWSVRHTFGSHEVTSI